MKVVILCHSILSCWNHGNAHFLRGIVRELQKAGHEVRVLEPENGWSCANLLADHGPALLEDAARTFPFARSSAYAPAAFDPETELDGADLVLVHEWTDPEVVARIARHRARGAGYRLFFHDTHHRAVSAPEEIDALALDAFDGILAFGEAIREVYAAKGWGARAFTWHEAADTDHFRPLLNVETRGDLVWIGNWGDEERTEEIGTFLLEPIRRLGLTADVHGVRYPEDAIAAVEACGARYRGWLPNHLVPERFAAHRATVHVPRRPYVERLPGIPTIRVFEALACGIPLVSAPWDDAEGLFREGDFLWGRSSEEMAASLGRLANDPGLAADTAARGLETIRSRHTCAHRVEELTGIAAACGAPAVAVAGRAAE